MHNTSEAFLVIKMTVWSSNDSTSPLKYCCGEGDNVKVHGVHRANRLFPRDSESTVIEKFRVLKGFPMPFSCVLGPRVFLFRYAGLSALDSMFGASGIPETSVNATSGIISSTNKGYILDMCTV